MYRYKYIYGCSINDWVSDWLCFLHEINDWMSLVCFLLAGHDTPEVFFAPCKVHHHGVGKNRGKESSGAHARTHTDTHGESVSQCTVTILQASSFFICLTGQNYRQFFDRGFGINRSGRAAAGQGVLDALKRVRHYRSAAELLIFRWA